MNYNELRELDAEVAEQVMGWTRHVEKPDRTDNRQIDGVLYCPPDYPKTLLGGLNVVPHYSTKTANAMSVVEQLRTEGYYFTCGDRHGNPWWAEFANEDYTIGGQGSAEKLELAICHAALNLIADIERVKQRG